MATVLNKRRGETSAHAVYVGRPTVWGNPFVVGQHGAAGECAALYKAHLWNDAALLARLPELADRDLVCWCSPNPCHADHLLAAAAWAKANPEALAVRIRELGADDDGIPPEIYNDGMYDSERCPEDEPEYWADITPADEDGLCNVAILHKSGELYELHTGIRFDHAEQWAAQEVECVTEAHTVTA